MIQQVTNIVNNNLNSMIPLKLNIIKPETKVVSVRVDDIRPKHNNLVEWIADPNNIYIGRSVYISINGQKIWYPPNDSIWGNPYKNGTTEDNVNMYRTHIVNELRTGKISINELEKLRGKNLGCWCKKGGQDFPCHGDVLLTLLELNKQGLII